MRKIHWGWNLKDRATIAAMAAMLLSEDGRWINGQVIHVNGGALLI